MVVKKRKNYSSTKGLSEDEIRWNRAARKKGKPGSKPYKRLIWGHKTNVRKGRV